MMILMRSTLLRIRKIIASVYFHTTCMPEKCDSATAAVIVIGDEILKGQVTDTNSGFIAKHLFQLGIKLRKISVVGDHEDEVAQEVRNFSKKYTYVITTGGIGPTHDDVTFSAIAKAFGEKVIPHPELVKLCSDFFKTSDLKSPAMKLAHVPESAKLTYGYDKVKGRRTLYPNVSVHNVYIFPGIPNLMERLFLAVYEEQFGLGCRKQYTEDIYVIGSEVSIADQLNAIVDKFPNVSFGSYPQLFNRYYKVHLTMMSESKDEVQKAYNALKAALPKDFLVNFDNNPTSGAYQKIMDLQMPHVIKALEEVKKICNSSPPTEICVFVNGGPASIVTLHLLHACLRQQSGDAQIKAIYFTENDHAKDMEEYLQDTQLRYNLKINRFVGPLDSVLSSFSEECKHRKLVFFGCTSLCAEEHEILHHAQLVCPSLSWTNPLKEWTSHDLWNFIHSLSLPYCSSLEPTN